MRIRWLVLSVVSFVFAVTSGLASFIAKDIGETKGVFPVVNYYFLNSDPTVTGQSAPLYQLLWRTDNGSIYYKSGPNTTDWTLAGISSATTANIPNGSVTYAKIQDVSATNRFLGRISGGPGDVEELTGTQATTLLDSFTSVLKGLVPASGGGTANFLRADGSWSPIGSIQSGDFGLGSDGDVVFDGTTTILGMIPVANVYTMVDDLDLDDATVNNGVTVKTANFRMVGTGVLTNNGTISNTGANASGITAGAAVTAHAFGTTLGGGAGRTVSGAGNPGTTSTACPRNWTTDTSALGGVGLTNGGNGAFPGRGGGGGGASASQGGNSGTVTINSADSGGPIGLYFLMWGKQIANSTAYTLGSGGGSGGFTGTTGTSGAGGAGGGWVFVAFPTITGSGAFEAKGGNGSAAVAGDGTTGGGGGGGGGWVTLEYANRLGSWTVSVAGGSGGAGANSAGNGGNGFQGTTKLINISGNGT